MHITRRGSIGSLAFLLASLGAAAFTLLSDPEGRVHDLYEAWLTNLLGRTSVAVRRCSYLIDRDGIIRKTYGERMVVATLAGIGWSAVSPVPSCPLVLRPQQYASPLSLTPQL